MYDFIVIYPTKYSEELCIFKATFHCTQHLIFFASVLLTSCIQTQILHVRQSNFTFLLLTVYDDYKFVTRAELEEMNLTQFIGSSLLRAYMHGFFMDIRLYKKVRFETVF